MTKKRKKLSIEELIDRLAGIRLLSLDVDGVLTDGGLYYGQDGGISRKFNVRDGVGMRRVQASGVALAIISAGASGSIGERARTLGVEHVFTGVDDKLETLTALCRDLGVDLSQVAHVGDDINDLGVMGAVGCPLTVADAVPPVRDAALYVTERGGGHGAVREICDMMVEARDGPAA